VVGVGEAGWAQSRDAVRALRVAGLSADAAFEARPIGTQLKMADRAGARYALIIGEKEIRARTVTLRRLSDGHQDEVSLQQAVERVVADRGSP